MQLKTKILLRFSLIILSLAFVAVLPAQNVVINEVQYTNKNTLLDHEGDTPDWIELYNNSESIINLEGFALSDSKDKSDYWKLPKIDIAPKEFLLVFASGKNGTYSNTLHADFKLRVMADSLFLINPYGKIIDEVVAQCVPEDKTLGSLTDGGKERRVLTPTPGKTNTTSTVIDIDYKPDTLIVSNGGGRYINSVEIELKNNVETNTIYYSVNGDDPDENEEIYTDPFTFYDISGNENRFAKKVEDVKPENGISKANILRAMVYSEGCPASNEISNTYFVGNEKSFKYNVPMVSIITDRDNLFDDDKGIYVSGNNENFMQRGSEWERPAQMEYYTPDGERVVDQQIGIRINGSGSRSLPQKSLRLYAKNKYGKGEFSYPFFENKPQTNIFKTLVLRTPYFDFSGLLFKEELCHKIVDPMNIDNTEAQTVIAYLNGEYWGIYSLRERHDEQYITNNYGVENPEMDVVIYQKEIQLNSGTMDSYNELVFWISDSDPTSSDFYSGASELIDLEAMADYYIAQLYMANYDFPNRNLDMWRLRNDTSRWRYFFFDLDAAMVKTDYDHMSEYGNMISDFQRFDSDETLLLRKMLENKQFSDMFYSRYLNHLQTTLSTNRVLELIADYTEVYEPLISEQAYRWGVPTDYNKWKENVKDIEDFAVVRPLNVMEQMDKNFDNPFDIYPNPCTTTINVDFGTNEYSEYEYLLFDMAGQLLENGAFEESQANSVIDIDYESGMYLLRVKMGTMFFTDKIIVE